MLNIDNIRAIFPKKKNKDKEATANKVKLKQTPRDTTIQTILIEIKSNINIDRVILANKTGFSKNCLNNALEYLEVEGMIERNFIRKSGEGNVYHYNVTGKAMLFTHAILRSQDSLGVCKFYPRLKSVKLDGYCRNAVRNCLDLKTKTSHTFLWEYISG